MDVLVIEVKIRFPDGFESEDPKRARLVAGALEARILDSTGDDGEDATVSSQWRAA